MIETVAEAMQYDSTEGGYIRNVRGKDANATCYIEVWDISSTGSVTRRKQVLKAPVYGLYTEDIDWIFSDILDADIGIS